MKKIVKVFGKKLETCINPLDVDQHPENAIVNVVSGKMYNIDKSGVYHALEISDKQLSDFEKKLSQ